MSHVPAILVAMVVAVPTRLTLLEKLWDILVHVLNISPAHSASLLFVSTPYADDAFKFQELIQYILEPVCPCSQS